MFQCDIYIAFDLVEYVCCSMCGLQPGVAIQDLPQALTASETFLPVCSNGQNIPCISEEDSTACMGVLEDKV